MGLIMRTVFLKATLFSIGINIVLFLTLLIFYYYDTQPYQQEIISDSTGSFGGVHLIWWSKGTLIWLFITGLIIGYTIFYIGYYLRNYIVRSGGNKKI